MKLIKLIASIGIILSSSICHANFSAADAADEFVPADSSTVLKFSSDEDLKNSIDVFDRKLNEIESIKRSSEDEAMPTVTYEPKPVKINYQCEQLPKGHVKVILKHHVLCVGDADSTKMYPVAIGKRSTPTPSGQYRVINKREWPAWFPSEKVRHENPDKILPKKVPGGKGNPLGARAIYLDHDGIRIHGTNRESSISKEVSHGCIRMHNKHIEEVYQMVAIDSPVSIE